MALGTTDEIGHPWVSPVWYASEDYLNFLWVSSPDAKHSRNLAVHAEVAVAIFDSSVPVGGAEAVYMKGVADELTASTSNGARRYSTACPKRRSATVGY